MIRIFLASRNNLGSHFASNVSAHENPAVAKKCDRICFDGFQGVASCLQEVSKLRAVQIRGGLGSLGVNGNAGPAFTGKHGRSAGAPGSFLCPLVIAADAVPLNSLDICSPMTKIAQTMILCNRKRQFFLYWGECFRGCTFSDDCTTITKTLKYTINISNQTWAGSRFADNPEAISSGIPHPYM